MLASPAALVVAVAVVVADVDPAQSIWRPHSAIAAIVGGEGQWRSNERKAIEAVVTEERAVMDEGGPACEPGRESRMRKSRTRKAAAAEVRTSAHAAKTRASAHAAEMSCCHAAGMHATPPPSGHAAGVHATSHAPAHAAGVHATTHAAASTTAAKGERRRRNS